MQEEFVTKAEHSEFVKGIDERFKRRDDENDRQNKRLDIAEKRLEMLTDISISVKEMAIQVKAMTAEIKKQGDRLEAIEKEPAENWKKVVWYIGMAVFGGVLALVGQQVGLSM